jgi:hypothetical protein
VQPAEYSRSASLVEGRVDLDCHFRDRGMLDGEIRFRSCER